MTELEEVKKRLRYYNKWRRGGEGEQPNPTQLGHDLDYAVRALTVYEAILEKRVLLVPVEISEHSIRSVDKALHEHYPNARKMAVAMYKATTQAVDTEKLIEEITND